MKERIKDIVAEILYLDDPGKIADSASLYTELNMSSIDYVDLCYLIKARLDDRVSLENLWPFDRMLLDPHYHDGKQWTDAGWQQVRAVMGWEDRAKCDLQELYAHFSVDYIVRRIGQLA